jgi:polysaccharide pyruvyl transferase WcaK-like protein
MDAIDRECDARLLYEIPTIRPQFIYDTYQNRVRAVSMLPWDASLKMLGVPTYQSIMRTDMSLIFDAILFDRQLYNPLFNFLSTLSFMLPRAHKRGKTLGCFNVGVGPVNTLRGQGMLRDLCELMSFITVRDGDSLAILRSIGVQNPRILVTADAALGVRPCTQDRANEILNECGLSDAPEILALNISAYLDTWAAADHTPMGKKRFISAYSESLTEVLRTLKVPALFVCTQHHDVAVTKEIMGVLRSPERVAMVSNRELNHFEIKGVLSRVSLLFGMRLHAIILAASERTPVAALPHQPKVSHFLKTLGLERQALRFKDFSAKSMTDHLLSSWSQRETLRRTLGQVIPEQIRRSEIAAKLVAGLHRGNSVEQLVSVLTEPTQIHPVDHERRTAVSECLV